MSEEFEMKIANNFIIRRKCELACNVYLLVFAADNIG